MHSLTSVFAARCSSVYAHTFTSQMHPLIYSKVYFIPSGISLMKIGTILFYVGEASPAFDLSAHINITYALTSVTLRPLLRTYLTGSL